MTTTERAPDIIVDTDTGEIRSGDGELFPGNLYDRHVPTLDGHRADTLRLAFAGSVDIDLMDEEALAWFKNLRFGQELDLHVTAVVGKNGWTLKTNADGDETVTHTLGLAVHSYGIEQ